MLFLADGSGRAVPEEHFPGLAVGSLKLGRAGPVVLVVVAAGVLLIGVGLLLRLWPGFDFVVDSIGRGASLGLPVLVLLLFGLLGFGPFHDLVEGLFGVEVLAHIQHRRNKGGGALLVGAAGSCGAAVTAWVLCFFACLLSPPALLGAPTVPLWAVWQRLHPHRKVCCCGLPP